MADETISTRIVANADFSALIADVHKVTASLSRLQEQLANSNKMLANNVALMNRNFADTLRSTGQYSTHFVSLTSDVEKFGKNLDGGRLKLRDYFGTFQQHVKTSGGLIRELARQQVAMQNAILQPLGRNSQGLMQFNVHVPRGLDQIKNKTAIARQELQIMNRVIQDGAVQLINWGKNTQWAGRQLTVGLTLPIAAFGKAAADAFKVADQELTRLTKVYGDIAGTTAAELGRVREDVIATSKELSKAYGTSFTETISLAADIAATGKKGQELLDSVKETSRLAVLGEVDRQEAMKATLAIQTAFQQNTEQLSESINFLNAVENQTSTSLADLVEAIPKAGPVVKQLGGDVEDLALYMTAMREGGINASEGANALKSGLAALINPTKQTVGVMSDFGIDILSMVRKNTGDTTAMLFDLQAALDNLDPLQKAQAIEQLFGKFQFARISALLNNLGRQGSQTLQVLDLMKASASDLEQVAARELTAVTESASGKYKRAIESLRADLAGLGDQFLTIATTMINIVDKALKFFEGLPKPIKQAITFLGALTALAGPLIMITGVLANFFGYILKGVMHMKAFFKGGEGWKYLTPEMLAADKAGKLVEQTFYSDAKAAAVLQTALRNLIDEFSILEAKAKGGAMAVNPAVSTLAGNVVMGAGGREVVAGHPLAGTMGTRASTHMVPRAGLTEEQRMQQTIFGLVPGSIPVNRKIGDAPQIYMNQPLPPVPGLTQIGGVSTGVVSGEAARWHAMMATLAMQSKAEIETLKKQIATTGVVSKDFMQQFDDILPIVSGITDKAATQSALIVGELRAGKLTVEQARQQIIALNLEIERMIGAAVSTQAATMGRTINPTVVPTLNQPVVDASGKSNMRELFKKSKTRDLIDKVARSLGVRTSGAGYNIETTRLKKFADGGTVVGGPRSETTDTQYMELREGDYVLNRRASDNLLGFNNGGLVPAMVTPGEIVIHNPSNEEVGMLEAYNNQFAIGGRVTMNRPNYGRAAAASSVVGRAIQALSKFHRKVGTVQTTTRNAVASTMLGQTGSKYERQAVSNILTTRSGRHRDRAHINEPVEAMARASSPYAMRGYFGEASVNEYNAMQNLLFRSIGTKNVNPVTDITAQTITLPSIFAKMGAGTFWKNQGAPGGKINQDAINLYLANLENYVKGGRWQSLPFGPIPRNLVNLLKGGKVKPQDFSKYIKYLMGGKVKETNRVGIIANDAAALMEARKLSPEAAVAEATLIYEKTLGAKNISDVQYRNARRKLNALEYSDFVVPYSTRGRRSAQRLNRGGMVGGIRGYNKGGGVGMGSVLGGIGLSMAGGAMGGTAGSVLSGVGFAMQMAPMLTMIPKVNNMLGKLSTAFKTPIGPAENLANKLTKTSGGFSGMMKMFGPVLRGLAGILRMFSPLGIAITVVTTALSLGIKMWKDHAERQRVARIEFGMTADSAKKAGLKYVDYNQRIKDAIENAKALAERNRMIYESMTMSNTPLKMTIEQYKKLREQVKNTMGDYIKLFDQTDKADVGTLATRLKSQFMAAGDSAETATAKIYTLIASSNKSAQASSAISSSAFKGIQTLEDAAEQSIKTFEGALQSSDMEGQAQSLFAAFSAIDASIANTVAKSEEAAKKNKGNAITVGEAQKQQIEKLNTQFKKQRTLSTGVIDEIKKISPELGKVLNNTDTVTSAWSKYQLMVRGITVDLQKMNGTAANAAMSIISSVDSLTSSYLKAGGPTKALYTKYDELQGKIKSLQKAAAGQSAKEQIDTRKTIEGLNKKIAKIKEEAESRIKALRAARQDENDALEIQKLQLEYQQALARGDKDAATQAQFAMQQKVGDVQLRKAEESIMAKAELDIAPYQKQIDAINSKNQALADKAALAGDSLSKLQSDADKLKKNIDDLNGALSRILINRLLDPSYAGSQREKDDMAALGKTVGAAGLGPKIPVVPKGQEGTALGRYANDLKNKGPLAVGEDILSGITKSLKDNGIVTDQINIYGKEIKNPAAAPTKTPTAPGSRGNTTYGPGGTGYGGSWGQWASDANTAPGRMFGSKPNRFIYDSSRVAVWENKDAEKFKEIAKRYNVKLAKGGLVKKYADGGYVSPRFNIPMKPIGGINTNGANNSYNNNVYNIDIDLNGTNVTADDIMRRFKAELALINAKEGRVRTVGGNNRGNVSA